MLSLSNVSKMIKRNTSLRHSIKRKRQKWFSHVYLCNARSYVNLGRTIKLSKSSSFHDASYHHNFCFIAPQFSNDSIIGQEAFKIPYLKADKSVFSLKFKRNISFIKRGRFQLFLIKANGLKS